MATASAIDWPALEKALRRVLPPRAVVSKAQELLSYDCDGLTMDRISRLWRCCPIPLSRWRLC